jgi:hypothetical protein
MAYYNDKREFFNGGLVLYKRDLNINSPKSKTHAEAKWYMRVKIDGRKGRAINKPFPSVKPPQPSVSNTTQQATPNSAVGSQSFTSKDIRDIRKDYLQRQSELQPIKPQSPF